METLRKGRNLFRGYHQVRRRSISQHSIHVNWKGDAPRLLLTADTQEFDPSVIQHFKDEGFDVAYLPQNGVTGIKCSVGQLHRLEEPLEDGDRYAIVGKPQLGRSDALMMANDFSGYSLRRRSVHGP